MKFTAVGDAIIGKRIHENFEGFGELTDFIMQGGARFFNLETTLNYEGECFASQFSGGTYLRTNPEVLDDLKKFGFNVTSFNNNHAMDYSYDGLIKTFDYVKESGLIQSGVGRNLAEASAPCYVETDEGRVAVISLNTIFDPSMIAGNSTQRIKGRPGINAVRVSRVSVVTQQDFNRIKQIAVETKVNAYDDIIRKEGYLTETAPNFFKYGNETFCVGDKPCIKHELNETDLERIEKSIYEAKLQADYIMVSIHSHEISGSSKEKPADFLVELAHKCIDMGANAIVGHGPHLLRPIEIYKDCPVFYSLGDFILQLYNVAFAPAEMYEKYGLTSGTTVHELLKKRSHDFTIGLMEDKKMFEAVIPYWETEDGKLKKLVLMPISLAMKGNKSETGLPRRDYDPEFLDRLAEISEPYGVKMTLNNDKLIECSW